jgi:transketolase
MEGISAEAGALAGHLALGKLVCLYDANDISLDGPCSLAFSENIEGRFLAQGWQVLKVSEGNSDLQSIDEAIKKAKAETSKPSLIIVKTTIGFGSPNKQNTSSSHGSPLGTKETALTKEALGFDPQKSFYVPSEAAEHLSAHKRGSALEAQWNTLLADYTKAHPDLAAQFKKGLSHKLPGNWEADLPKWDLGSKPVATRVASHKVINGLAKSVPFFVGGDADLSCSTKTAIEGGGSLSPQSNGRNIHFGVREHAMGSIANGMAYHGGLHPYVATFFVFSDYVRPAIRLAALNALRVTFVFTHDSIALGEDGPTHQPVEHLMSLRVMPHLAVMRPADANEACAAWKFAMQRQGPVALVLSRQDLPIVTTGAGVERGAYVLSDAAEAQALIIATGSEVALALEAQKQLQAQGIAVRVVSMPCMEAFLEQDAAYRDSVLPQTMSARVVIEAGATLGWERFAGANGIIMGVDDFGASAPGEVLMEKYGFTVENVVKNVKSVIQSL